MKTKVKTHLRKTKRKKVRVRRHTRKIKKPKCPVGQAWDPRLKRCVPCPGGRIRSQGLGRGLGFGRGRGPIGIPIGQKMFGSNPNFGSQTTIIITPEGKLIGAFGKGKAKEFRSKNSF